jgi:hypothetical protein
VRSLTPQLLLRRCGAVRRATHCTHVGDGAQHMTVFRVLGNISDMCLEIHSLRTSSLGPARARAVRVVRWRHSLSCSVVDHGSCWPGEPGTMLLAFSGEGIRCLPLVSCMGGGVRWSVGCTQGVDGSAADTRSVAKGGGSAEHPCRIRPDRVGHRLSAALIMGG